MKFVAGDYPKHNIAIGSQILRRQPPYIIYWCHPPRPDKAANHDCVVEDHGCDGATTPCPLCLFPYCAAHLRRHRFHSDFPIDLWRKFSRKRRTWYAAVGAPRTRPGQRALDIRNAHGALISGNPPVVGTFCLPPTATNSWRDGCVFPAKTCKGPQAACPVCAHKFCAHHFQQHIRRFECPADVWRWLDADRKAWLEKIRKDPRLKPRIYVNFPEVAP